MKKKFIISTLSILVLFLLLATVTSASELDASKYEVTICTVCNEDIKVEETLTFQGSSTEYIDTIDFWIQNGANSISIVVNGSTVTSTSDGSKYTINISDMQIAADTQLTAKVTYFLDKGTVNFQKELLQATDSFKVTFDTKIIYLSTNLATGESFTLSLYKTSEETTTPLSMYYITIGLLILVILVLLVYSIKRKNPSKIRERTNATEELLSTKKTLLMSILKEIEKQHRAKEISDDTYHKLKEEYKQDTVQAMKGLEDMKSKVK